jgi:nucleotide-binding universal stress UspA family protein
MSKRRKILVPTDYTRVSDCAMNHAMGVAERDGAEVYLLHIVADRSDADEARQKLDMEIPRAKRWSDRVPVFKLVRVGTIFEDIGNSAAEIGADLIVMGTHGVRSMQFLRGSRALRVIMNSTVPFVVVQERNIRPQGYHHIVVPMDLHKETRQKLTHVAELAKRFNSTAHLVVPKETDEFLHNQSLRNIQFAEQYLNEHGVAHRASVLEADSGDLAEAVLAYAKTHDADLIAIVNMQQESLFSLPGTSGEQEILSNEAMVPVMCMNPVATTVSGPTLLYQ